MINLYFVLIYVSSFRNCRRLKSSFEIGFEPKEQFFYELTADQYQKLSEQGVDISIKWYTIISDHPKHQTSELLILSANDKYKLNYAVQYVEKVSKESGQEFSDFTEKLQYVARTLPPILTEHAPQFHKKPYLKIVK